MCKCTVQLQKVVSKFLHNVTFHHGNVICPYCFDMVNIPCAHVCCLKVSSVIQQHLLYGMLNTAHIGIVSNTLLCVCAMIEVWPWLKLRRVTI